MKTFPIIPNPYIKSQKSFFLEILISVNKLEFSNQAFDNESFVVASIKYPIWKIEIDIFQFLSKEILFDLQNKKKYFIFDASWEGFDPIREKWFDMLYYNCKKYNIDPSSIIFVSSNLEDENNFLKYNLEKKEKPFHIISFPMFENIIDTKNDILKEIENSINNTKCLFQNKYFSSLSRRNKDYRMMAQFLIYHSNYRDQALISQNKLERHNLFQQKWEHIFKKLPQYNINHVLEWDKKLPIIIDHKNFNINWAVTKGFEKIHDQTLFHIANESLVTDQNSMFYSEKTFRPIKCFQPFLIYGQPRCNHYLKNLGYKTYEDWFDLSFDFEEDPIDRYLKILKIIEETCKFLDSLNTENKINWKFKNIEILIHNYKTMKDKEYTKEKIKNWIQKTFIHN